jgi:hypothetical protein
MRFRTSTTTALCVLAAGLAVGGCTSSSSSSASGTPATSASTQTGAATSTATSTPASSPSTQAAGSGGACQAQNLSFALGAKTGTSGQSTQAVVLTNKGSAACTMTGFPGVDLVGAANGQQNYSWPLERQTVSYSRVTLPPGGTAHFNLIYLPSTPGDGTDITVAKMVITPPNTYTQAQLTWNQSVLLQDAATHPGTYISPVASGA